MLKILDEREQNSFYDPKRRITRRLSPAAHRVRIRGYPRLYQRYKLRDFGDRYITKWDVEIYVNTMDREPTFESTFPDTPLVRRLFDALGNIYRKYVLFKINELYLYEEV